MKRRTRIDTDITLVFLKRYSDQAVRLLAKTPVTPVHIGVFSFLLFVPPTAYLLFVGGHLNNIIALCILILHSFLDLMDGELARQKKMSSRLGIWLEESLDPLTQTVVILSISLHILTNVEGPIKYLVFMCLFGQSFANMLGTILATRYKIDPLTGNKNFNDFVGDSKHYGDFLLKNILVPSYPVFVVLLTMRFYLIVGILVNQLPLFFYAFGIAIVVRAISVYAILTYHYMNFRKNSKYKVFSYLNREEFSL